MQFARIYIYLLLAVLVSCKSSDNELGRALYMAQGNREILQSALDSLRNDSLSHLCAKFLIANSIDRYTVESEAIDSIEELLSGIVNPEQREATRNRVKKWEAHSFADANRIPDLKTLPYKTLIDNIKLSVEASRSRKWNSTLPTEEFLQLILPYKIGDERLSNWRALYTERYGCMLDSTYDGNDVLIACATVLDTIKCEGNTFNDQFHTPHHNAIWLFHNRIGNCRDGCDRMLYALRACGIPVTTDHIIGSPENGGAHQWMVVRDNFSGRFIPFDESTMPDRNSIEPYDSTRLKGKVYRKVFGYVGITNDDAFPHKSYIDVTGEYFGENEARVPVAKSTDEVYLGVFVNGSWHVIGKGNREDNEYIFQNVEPGIFYVALSTNNHGKYGYEECSNPFTVLADGSTHVFNIDNQSRRSVKLTRKRMLNTRMLRNWMHNDMVGCRITLSNGTTFTSMLYL